MDSDDIKKMLYFRITVSKNNKINERKSREQRGREWLSACKICYEIGSLDVYRLSDKLNRIQIGNASESACATFSPNRYRRLSARTKRKIHRYCRHHRIRFIEFITRIHRDIAHNACETLRTEKRYRIISDPENSQRN